MENQFPTFKKWMMERYGLKEEQVRLKFLDGYDNDDEFAKRFYSDELENGSTAEDILYAVCGAYEVEYLRAKYGHDWHKYQGKEDIEYGI